MCEGRKGRRKGGIIKIKIGKEGDREIRHEEEREERKVEI